MDPYAYLTSLFGQDKKRIENAGIGIVDKDFFSEHFDPVSLEKDTRIDYVDPYLESAILDYSRKVKLEKEGDVKRYASLYTDVFIRLSDIAGKNKIAVSVELYQTPSEMMILLESKDTKSLWNLLNRWRLSFPLRASRCTFVNKLERFHRLFKKTRSGALMGKSTKRIHLEGIKDKKGDWIHSYEDFEGSYNGKTKCTLGRKSVDCIKYTVRDHKDEKERRYRMFILDQESLRDFIEQLCKSLYEDETRQGMFGTSI